MVGHGRLRAGTEGALLRLDPEDGAILDSFVLGPEPAGIAFGAGWIWVGDQVEAVVYGLQA